MPAHIEDGSGAELRGHEALVELLGGKDLLHQLLRDGFTGGVLRILREQRRLEGPVLVELREHLHEVARDIGAAHGRVVALGQQAVQGVAELVEGRLHLVDGKVVVGEIADVHDDRADVVALSVHVLLADVVHPRAAALAWTRLVVGREDTHQRAVLGRHLVGAHLRVVHRHAFQALEVHAVEDMRVGEDAVHDAVNLEIGLGLRLIQVVLGLADLLGIVPPVPRLDPGAGGQLALLHLLIHHGLHVGQFGLGAGHGRGHDLAQEIVHGLGVARHLVGEDVCGGVGIAQDLRLLGAQVEHLEQELAVVELIAAVSAGSIGLVVLATQVAVLRGRHLVGVGGHAESELVQEVVGLREDIVADLLRLGGDGGIDLAQARLLLLGQADALALEGVEVLLQHHLLLARQAALVAVVHGCHAVVERLVERHIVLMLAHQGDGFLLDGGQRVGAVGLGNVVEHAHDLAENAAGELQRRDGVLEGGRVRVGRDGVDFGGLLLDARLDGGNDVSGLDLFKRRDAVRGVPFRQEGVDSVVAGCHG